MKNNLVIIYIALCKTIYIINETERKCRNILISAASISAYSSKLLSLIWIIHSIGTDLFLIMLFGKILRINSPLKYMDAANYTNSQIRSPWDRVCILMDSQFLDDESLISIELALQNRRNWTKCAKGTN